MRYLTTTLARVLRPRREPAEAGIHLHGGAGGAYVCDIANCSSPALDPRDS